jgi:hypothetical protein
VGDMETCLGLLFKNKGKGVLTEKEFVFTASMDHRWFSPKEAQVLLELGIKRGLLTRTEGFVKPTFVFKDIEVPQSFKPCKDILRDIEPEVSVFSLILDEVSKSTGQTKRDIVAKINKVQDRLGVDIEIAALAVAKDSGIDISKFVTNVKKEVLSH